MESDSGPVEIAIGTMDAGGPQIRGRMCSSGWECLEFGEEHTSLASRKKVGETTIVLLDEKEGKFLLLRRQE